MRIDVRTDTPGHLSTGVVGAVDIGGTKIAAAAVDADGAVTRLRTVGTPSGAGPEAVLQVVRDLVGDLRDVRALGVGCAGVVDPATGDAISATDTIADWAGTPLRSELSGRLGLSVTVVNDVHAHAVGESWHGAGASAGSMLLVTAGTGIGGAWTVAGHVVVGAGGAAGHVGHVPVAAAAGRRCGCGAEGHVEAVASGPAMTAEYARRSGTRVSSLSEVVTAAEAGDEAAIDVLTGGGAALGSAVGGIVNVLDPDLVVIGGGVAAGGAHWWSALRAAATAELLPATRGVRIVPSTLGGRAALIGAARLAWRVAA
ncbi:ROK family protein [Jiangella alba]|uniref:Glucokinase n=1 Tax=Jiangella alba TaxID=561176 RepID=A0A1H5PYV4_9ACTN|nr:ROK family protein [Jiangella alba]SEF18834.1 glucokinase [Jiangella alba]